MFASLVPPRPALDDLETALAELPSAEEEVPALRWVPAHQRHITLAFHGEVPDQEAERIRAELAALAAATPSPILRLAGAGVFSDRVLWAGVQTRGPWCASSPGPAGTTLDPLVELMIACRDVVSEDRLRSRPGAEVPGPDDSAASAAPAAPVPAEGSSGSDSPAEDPVPHLTLARSPRRGVGIEQIRRRAEELADYAGPEWRAGELLLMRSQLGAGPRGTAHHTVVAELPLAG